MKRCMLLFIALSSIAYTQFEDRPSVIIPPPFLSASPNGTRSTVVEINGYDNIFLGIDFGEPYISANPRDPLNSICAYNINGLYYTLDGFNWTRNVPAFPGYNVLGDPVMTFDSLGNCIYALLYQNGVNFGTVVMKTTNKGVNWIGPYNVFSTTIGLVDKEWIAADQTGGPYSNYLYLGWRQYGSTGMRFVRSTNGGVNWTSPMTMNGTQNAYITIGPNGDIQGGSVYFGSTSNNAIVVSRSTDGGSSFLPQVLAVNVDPPGILCAGRRTVKDCIRMNHIPSFAADNSFTSTRGNVYAVYCGNPPGPDNCDIYLIRSTDYGQTWSTGMRVNDDNTTTDQWLPTITVDKVSGKIFVGWYDSRVDPVSNLLTRIYGAVSTNGGISFLPNDNISDVSFNPNLMALSLPGGEKYIGDYIGNTAIGSTSYIAWMDGRNNNLGSYVGYYPDYALTVSPSARELVNGDSTTFSVIIPSTRGPFSESVKFTAALDSLPQSGTLQISFAGEKDSISSFPDSVSLKIRAVGSVTPGLYKLIIRGQTSLSVAPVHIRTVDLLIINSIGITVLGSEIPNEYKLHQNFPNPFNPLTKIRFNIPGSEIDPVVSKIIIYDALGKEIETLINSKLSAGMYEAEWNASEFPSGVYFFRLNSGKFSEVKKMVLLK